jgi:hypothetical protein
MLRGSALCTLDLTGEASRPQPAPVSGPHFHSPGTPRCNVKGRERALLDCLSSTSPGARSLPATLQLSHVPPFPRCCVQATPAWRHPRQSCATSASCCLGTDCSRQQPLRCHLPPPPVRPPPWPPPPPPPPPPPRLQLHGRLLEAAQAGSRVRRYCPRAPPWSTRRPGSTPRALGRRRAQVRTALGAYRAGLLTLTLSLDPAMRAQQPFHAIPAACPCNALCSCLSARASSMYLRLLVAGRLPPHRSHWLDPSPLCTSRPPPV